MHIIFNAVSYMRTRSDGSRCALYDCGNCCGNCCAVDAVSYTMEFTSSCDVPCDVLLGSVCQHVIDSIPGETHDVTIALMHVDQLVYAIVSFSVKGNTQPLQVRGARVANDEPFKVK